MDMNKKWWLVGGGTFLVFCCVCYLCLAIFTGVIWQHKFSTPTGKNSVPTSTPLVQRPTLPPTFQPQNDQNVPVDPALQKMVETLENTLVPENDLLNLTNRLGNGPIAMATLTPPPAPLAVGTQSLFWVTDTDTNQNTQVPATLQYVTDHVYFWIADGVSYNQNDLSALVETFENEIYPTDRAFFGSEWSPGIDGDPHLYILFTPGMGSSVAGYYSSADEVLPQVHEYSNTHEMFLLSADNVTLDDQFTYGVLAHEFQHMIHWAQDRNESTWLNEGFSELAAFLNGYDVGGFDALYAYQPDLQLNTWPDPSQADTAPHYGASFLFLTYFLDRFGASATQALVKDPENGLASVDAVLKEIGQSTSADEVFRDWTVTELMNDPQIGDGRYAFQQYSDAPQTQPTEDISSCPTDVLTRSVSQYGVDYVQFTCQGSYQIHFEGSTVANLLPQTPHSGRYAFWSNQGDESDMALTHEFDLHNVSGAVTFSFWTWYDLEADYDYLYLEASTDGGQTWQILPTPSGTGEDPSGNSYGWAYNGFSGGGAAPDWIQEQVDLSQFAGQMVQIRFEYITDAAVNGEGLILDDVSIPQIDYSSDFEQDDGGWQAAGFVRYQNLLPQTYLLTLITRGKQTTVENISLPTSNSLDIPVQIGGDVEDVILVISGTTRFTRQPAAYRLQVQSAGQ